MQQVQLLVDAKAGSWAAKYALLAVPSPAKPAENSPMRLFTFQLLDGPGGAS